MLVDMRDRLRAQGELPPLPPQWGAEVALESAYGDSFAGDFVVASRSTDGRTLEVALVDVSGKGREAGARSLLLSGALGGLLGEMSEGGFLQSANNHLLRLRWAEGFATAVHVAVNLETRQLHHRVCRSPGCRAVRGRVGSVADARRWPRTAARRHRAGRVPP